MLNNFLELKMHNNAKDDNKQSQLQRNTNHHEILIYKSTDKLFKFIIIILITIKQTLSWIKGQLISFYKLLEETYEISFVAGEEDAKLRERLRRKFKYSFNEFENDFDSQENELLENTFENTVYNALYTSELKHTQLKKMKFAPKVQIKNSDNKIQSKKGKEKNKIVLFNIDKSQ